MDGLTASIYSMVRLGGSAAGVAISVGAELADRRRSLRPVWETPRGKYVQSIMNGVWGDRFEEDASPFGIELGLRDSLGRRVPITPASLRQSFPRPSGRLAVMVHGLGENERSWESADGTGLADGLEADGFSVLRLRYNTGRTVTDNGSDLADLLEEVDQTWPVPVDEIALIGHSMGGLVVESAVAAAHESGQGWVERTSHLVALSTPHLGSPIEKLVHLVSKSLGLFRESRPLGAFLDQRSAGIRDLRHGPTVDGGPLGVDRASPRRRGGDHRPNSSPRCPGRRSGGEGRQRHQKGPRRRCGGARRRGKEPRRPPSRPRGRRPDQVLARPGTAGDFVCEPRGVVSVKGKGEIEHLSPRRPPLTRRPGLYSHRRMNEPDPTYELMGVLVETARAHHAATGGPSPEWAKWYAERALDEVNRIVGAEMTAADLADLAGGRRSPLHRGEPRPVLAPRLCHLAARAAPLRVGPPQEGQPPSSLIWRAATRRGSMLVVPSCATDCMNSSRRVWRS